VALASLLVKIFVYQTPGGEYAAGLDEIACSMRGRIVEKWTIDTSADAGFVARHGSAFGTVSERVTRLAEFVEQLLLEHPQVEAPLELKQAASQLKFWARLKLAWLILLGTERSSR
jgi:hypothetical protein